MLFWLASAAVIALTVATIALIYNATVKERETPEDTFPSASGQLQTRTKVHSRICVLSLLTRTRAEA